MKNLIKIVLLLACAIGCVGYAVHEYKRLNQTQIPSTVSSPSKTVQITVNITADAYGPKAQGVSPGTIQTFGKVENLPCANPHNPACLMDRTMMVNGGALNITYNLPEGKETDIGFKLNGFIRVDGIQANGVPLTSFKIVGTPPEIWVLACFIPWMDDKGVVHALPSPNCTATVR